MFALRTSSHNVNGSSGKPDGMFVREDGWFTSNKSAAKLFDTSADAVTHYHTILAPLWNYTPGGAGAAASDLFAVEVETKPIIHKVKPGIASRM